MNYQGQDSYSVYLDAKTQEELRQMVDNASLNREVLKVDYSTTTIREDNVLHCAQLILRKSKVLLEG